MAARDGPSRAVNGRRHTARLSAAEPPLCASEQLRAYGMHSRRHLLSRARQGTSRSAPCAPANWATHLERRDLHPGRTAASSPSRYNRRNIYWWRRIRTWLSKFSRADSNKIRRQSLRAEDERSSLPDRRLGSLFTGWPNFISGQN